MPLSTRELYLVLRAKNETTRALNAMGKDLDKARSSAELMGVQAQKAHLASEQAAARNAKAHAEYAQRQLESQKATLSAVQAEKQAEVASLQHAQRVEALEKAHTQNAIATQRASVQTQVYARQAMEAQRADAQREIATRRSQIATVEFAASQLRSQQATQQNEQAIRRQAQAVDQNAISLVNNAREHNNVRIAQLRAVEGAGAQIAQLRDQNLALRDQAANLRDNVIARQNDINTAQQQINTTAQQINSSKQLVDGQKAIILNLQQEVNTRNQAIAAAKQAETQARQDIQVLEEQVRQRQANINATQASINSGREEISQMRDRIQAKQQEIQAQRDVVSNMRQEIADRQTSIQAVGREIDAIKKSNVEREEANRRLRQTGQEIASAGTASVIAGGAALTGVYQLTQAAVEYERATAMTKTQVDDTSVSLKQLGDIGLNVARDFGVSFDTIQKSFFDIFSSMDVNVPQAESLLRNFAKAAVAGGTDMQTAGRLVISQLNAFKIPVEDVGHVLDVQFRLVQKGVGTYEEFARSLGRAQPSAVRAGQSIETLSGMMALLTRSGLTVYNATASAGRALDLFANPKVVERLKEMGINARDSAGHFRPMADVVLELREKFAALDAPTRAAEMDALFKGSGNNVQARRFWDLVLASDAGAKEFKNMVNAMTDSGGTLEQKYGEMSDTLAVRNEKMKNQWKALAVEAGTALFPALEKIINGLSKLAEWFNDLSPRQQSFLAWAVVLGSVLLVAAGAILVVAGGIATLISVVTGAALAIGALVAILGGAFIAAWVYAYMKIEWFHNAVNAYVKGIVSVLEWLRDRAVDIWNAIVNLLQAAWRDIQTIWDALKAAVRAIGDAWDWLVGVARSAWEGIKNVAKAAGDFLNGVWEAIKTGLRALGDAFQALLTMVQPVWNGMKLAADIWWAAMQVMWGLVQIAIKVLIQAFQQLWNDVRTVWQNIQNFIQAAWNAIQSIWNAIISFIKGQFAAAWNWLYDSLIKPVWDKIREVSQAAWNWINANVFTPIMNFIRGPLAQAWDWLSDKISAVWTAIRNAGTAAWNWMRDNVFNPIMNIVRNDVPAAFDRAVGAIKSAWDKVQEVVRVPIRFVVNTVLNDGLLAGYNTIAKAFNVKPDNVQIQRLAAGGAVFGPGGPRDDLVPAQLSNGEHVWTAKEVEKAGGQRAMYRMRKTVMEGKAAFADGGAVSTSKQSWMGDGPFDWITGLVGGVGNTLGNLLNDINPASVLNKFINKLSEAGPGQMAAVAIAAGKKAIEGVIKWIGEKVGFGSGDAGTGKFQAQPNGWPAANGNQPPWSPNVQAAANLIRAMNPGMAMGSYVSQFGWSDHFPKAIDNMNNAYNPSELKRGNGIAKYFIEHPGQFGTKYVIWNKRITTGDGWGPYSVPGQGDHSNHVHLSFYKKGGAVAQQLMDRGGLLQPGMSNILNGTGSAERVLSVAQTQAFDRLVGMLDAERANKDMGATGLAPVGGFGGGRTGSSITLNVYTNEIDPRRHAMMLGMELEKVIG